MKAVYICGLLSVFVAAPLILSNFFNKTKNDEVSLNYRLPNNSVPLRYDLWIKTDVDKEIFEFSGRVKIHIKILESTIKLTLHLDKTKVDKIDLLDSKGKLTYSCLYYEYDEKREFLIIFLPKMMNENENFVLDIEYRGELREDMDGFYRASYENEKNETIWYGTTHFETIYARHAMPCYDEPHIRAVIGVQIQHSKNYNAISNMPIESREEVSNTEYVISKFIDTPPMQTYLLAFVISDFKFVSNNDSRVEQRVYANPPSISNDEVDYVLNIVGPLLTKLEELFDFEFPLPKIYHALITKYKSAATENFGMIAYNARFLTKRGEIENGKVVETEEDRKRREKGITRLVAHELTHQFIGDIVAPKWWSFIWLNEGFARFYDRILSSSILPDEDFIENFTQEIRKTSMEDEENYNRTLSFPAETSTEIKSSLQRIVYEKGAAIIRMFYEAMTPKTFSKGMIYYLKAMNFSAASPDDLHRELQRAFDEDHPGNKLDIGAAMKTWEDQEGYPILQVKKRDGKLKLTQENFKGGNEIYTIPISYTTSSISKFNDSTTKLWMTTKTAEIDFEDDWIIFNIGLSGYYRVSYEDKTFLAMIDLILTKNNTIPKIYRNEFIEDYLSKLVKLDGIQSLKIMELMKSESKWKEISKIFAFYHEQLYGTKAYPSFKKFMEFFIEDDLKILGFEKRKNESNDDDIKRYIIMKMSAQIGQKSFYDYESKKLEEIIATGEDVPYICRGFQQANASIQAKVVEKLSNSSVEDLLGCSFDRNVILSDLQTLLNKSVTNMPWSSYYFRETRKINPIFVDVALEYFVLNFEELLEKYPNFFELLLKDEPLYPNFKKNAYNMEKILKMTENSKNIDSVEVSRAFRKVEDVKSWAENNLAAVDNWLEGINAVA